MHNSKLWTSGLLVARNRVKVPISTIVNHLPPLAGYCSSSGVLLPPSSTLPQWESAAAASCLRVWWRSRTTEGTKRTLATFFSFVFCESHTPKTRTPDHRRHWWERRLVLAHACSKSQPNLALALSISWIYFLFSFFFFESDLRTHTYNRLVYVWFMAPEFLFSISPLLCLSISWFWICGYVFEINRFLREEYAHCNTQNRVLHLIWGSFGNLRKYPSFKP